MKAIINRDNLIDSLRGLMLVIMVLDHTPLFTKRYTYHTFGFFGAAMGFIFLSGYVFGMVYSRYLDNPGNLLKKTYHRIWLIYKYHFGLLLLVFLLNFSISVILNLGPINQELFNLYHSPQSIIKYLFLLNQPGGFDILPLYIVLLLISPLVLIGFNRGRSSLILLTSFIIWLLIQIPAVQQSYENLQSYLNIDLGYFNVLAWQFLFFLGQYLGFNRNQGIQFIKYSHTRLWIAFSIVVFFFLMRQIGHWIGWEFTSRFLDERTYLIAPRIINFIVFVYLIGGISKYLKVKNVNFLSFLGQYSIDVFAFHIPLTFLMIKGSDVLSGLNKPLQLAFAVCLVSSLIIPAIIRAEIKIGTREHRSKRLTDYISLLIFFPRQVYAFLVHTSFKKQDAKKRYSLN